LDFVLDNIGVAGQRSRRVIELFRRFPRTRFNELAVHASRADGVPVVRAAAIEALARAGGVGLSELAATLAGLMDDEVWTVRYAAANALRSFGQPGEKMLRAMA
ncbi:MAG: HEAT repeat domain-containing protein, partial [Mesorhizobium sp.]